MTEPLALMVLFLSFGFVFGLGFGVAMWLINALVASFGGK
jgi:hypothetical protein